MFKGKKTLCRKHVLCLRFFHWKEAGYILWIEAGWISQQNLSKLAI